MPAESLPALCTSCGCRFHFNKIGDFTLLEEAEGYKVR